MNGTMNYCLLKIYNVEANILNWEEYLKTLALKLAKEIKAKVLSVHPEQYDPYGLTICVILAESHIVITTYPESKILHVEIVTCSSKMNYQKGIDFILSNLNKNNDKKYELKIVTM